MTIEELAEHTGETLETLHRWQSLGLVGGRRSKDYRRDDIECVRLLQILLRRGLSLETIANSAQEGELGRRIDEYLDQLFPGEGRPAFTVAEAAEAAGLDDDLSRHLWDAMTLGKSDEFLNAGDVEMLRCCKSALAAGFPEEAMLQLLRVWSDALGRTAEAAQRLFHFYVRDSVDYARDPDPEQCEIRATAQSLIPMLEPNIQYFHRRGMVSAFREEIVMTAVEEAGLAAKGDTPGERFAAVAFIDLSSFTSLTDAMGDAAAARVLEQFAGMVRGATNSWAGHVVKQIGDAFMLVFPDPSSAVACVLEVEKRADATPQFPAVRSGVHWGPVLYREGDYVGSTVNVASRLAAQAERHQVLVSAEVHREARSLSDVEFIQRGKRRLKGFAEELELFEVCAAGVVEPEKIVDPVCGMELAPAEVSGRVSLGGPVRAFCSQECLRRFVANPERYAG